MKKLKYILTLIILVTFTITGYQLGDSFAVSNNYNPNNVAVASDSITPQDYPSRISIPRLGVFTDIEIVGKAADGSMDVPKDENNVGWWRYGAVPGDIGSVVLAGHIDRRQGGPGIFYNLDVLEIGDTVVVENRNGEKFTYKVVRKEVYADEHFPLEQVFNSSRKMLNLITCDGVFDRNQENYTQRLVVYTELQQGPKLFTLQ